MKKISRKKIIPVCVNDEEKSVIESRSNQVASRSVSSYLRTLGLGYEPKSTLDNLAILDLMKINGDQGRLGGLLKMLLSNQERHTMENRKQILRILADIEATQKKLLKAVDSL